MLEPKIKEIIFFDGLISNDKCHHQYKTIDEPTPPNVHVVKCQLCGKYSTTWSWNSLEHQK